MIGGGFKAIGYSLKVAREVGIRRMLKASLSRNTCKACALGMGGQQGGMKNEAREFPEVCKKSFQAQLTDIQDAIPETLFAEKTISELADMRGRELERLGRLNTPLRKMAGDTHYRPVTWEEAMEASLRGFKGTDAARTFFYSSGRSSNEAAFILQLFARLYGTNNVNNCSYYCHQASGVGLGSTIGSGTATIQLPDLEEADLIFVIGANPSSNHPRFVRQLMNCRRRGGEVIVVNPAKEPGLVRFAIPSDVRSMLSGGSPIASEYVQVNIGGDIALLKGMAKATVAAGAHDQEFMERYTTGSADYLVDLEDTSWDEIVGSCGIPRERIEHLATLYAKGSNCIFSWSMGITHHRHGVENVESIVALALLRGMIGRRHAGLLPLRGHSNVQGIGSVGVTPVLKKKIFENIESHLKVTLPTEAGMDTMACMQAADAGDVDAAFLLGGNLYSSNPDSKFAERALGRIPFKVFLNTTLNHGHFRGVDEEVIILPVAARDEEPQKTTQESMFNFVRLSDGGIVRLDNVRSEVDIISDLAKRILGDGPIDFDAFRQHHDIRKVIAKTIPGFEEIGKIDATGREFQVAGRTFHEPRFATADEKAAFKVCTIPAPPEGDDAFLMMTIRSEGQFNSIIYDEEDLYRSQTSRWVVLMNGADIERLGLHRNDQVTLKSSVGQMEKLTVREFDIPPGNLMTYYPESNVLVPTDVDPRSRTPGYKSVQVTLHADK